MIGRTNAVQENSISATIEVSAPTGSTVSCDGIVGQEQTVVNPKWRGLPSGYTQLDYVSGSGSSWFTLPFVPTTSTTYKAILSFNGVANEMGLMGSNWVGGGCFLMIYQNTIARWHGSKVYDSTTVMTNKVYTMEFGFSSFTSNDLTTTSSGSYSINTGSKQFGVFRCTGGSSSSVVNANMKLYALIVGGDFNYDLVPCKNSSNVAGFYDMTNNQFYSSASGTAFTAGTETSQYLGSGEWTFSNIGYGSHTVSAVYGGVTKTETVQVSSEQTYEVSFSFVPYAELTAIKSTGTQYLNTDINFASTSNFNYELDMLYTSTSSDQQMGAVKTYYHAFGINDNSKFFWAYGSGASKDFGLANTTEHIWRYSSTQVSIDSTSYSISVSNFPNTTCILFARTNDGTVGYYCNLIMKYAKLYSGSTLVRNYIPVELLESVVDYWGNTQPIGEIGMWDLVSNKFFPNNGTGEFIAIE